MRAGRGGKGGIWLSFGLVLLWSINEKLTFGLCQLGTLQSDGQTFCLRKRSEEGFISYMKRY